MNEPMLHGLTQRLDRLERENRRLKRVGAAVALGIAATVLMGQARTPGRVVEAERFVVRDASGRTRATLGVAAEGPVGLVLHDQNGEPQSSLTMKADGTGLLLRDPHGKAGSVLLHVGDPDVVALRLSDKDGKLRALLALLPDGNPRLQFLDKDEKVRAVLGHTSLEAMRTGTVEQRPASSLVLFDKDGKVIWSAP